MVIHVYYSLIIILLLKICKDYIFTQFDSVILVIDFSFDPLVAGLILHKFVSLSFLTRICDRASL